MNTYFLFKGPVSSTLCTRDNWVQATKTENSKDAERYLMSFECKTPEEASELKQVFNTDPDIFSMSHSELILEVKKLRLLKEKIDDG